jgi:hypothetical protein
MIGIVVNTDDCVYVVIYMEVKRSIAPHINDGQVAEQVWQAGEVIYEENSVPRWVTVL